MKKKTIRQSKRLIISLFVTFFCLTASAAQAQTALVTIDLQQVKMVQVMDEIENQTKYLFIYDKNMDTGRLVNVHVNKRPVAEALDQMVKGTDVVYEIQGSNIILTVRSQQTDGPKVVSGKVTDNKGDAVIGNTCQRNDCWHEFRCRRSLYVAYSRSECKYYDNG